MGRGWQKFIPAGGAAAIVIFTLFWFLVIKSRTESEEINKSLPPQQKIAAVVFQFLRKHPSSGQTNWQTGRPFNWIRDRNGWFLLAKPLPAPKKTID